ncbi:hypothetical protein CW613_000468 [Vibrio mimicus]
MDAIIARVGSDASYDLIMEAFPKNGKVECILIVTDEELASRSREIVDQIRARLEREDKFSLRLQLFQRFPDPWVWWARLDALLEKVACKEKGEVLPWL